ncbi:MAG TPA: radical SAM protein [Candidatus Dormibacteraeota bacterium]|nr:radical SAM protein [Candidatus Dormibacteraeota bacterium]
MIESAERTCDRLSFLSLEITGRCQLHCEHCYADSGPGRGHGVMLAQDWSAVLGEAALLGVQRIQLIGGEPTLHPDLQPLVERALGLGLEVEVFSNLVRIPPRLWDLFGQPGVRLACSYYSTRPDVHDRITRRPGSHARTRAAIEEAMRRRIPLRVGVVVLEPDQDTEAVRAELTRLGVERIEIDHVRQVGRGARGRPPSVEDLCGSCGDRKLAVSPHGDVWPCVMARWMTLGNVRDQRLGEVYRSSAGVRRELQEAMSARRRCVPHDGGCGAPVCCIPPHLR